MRYASGRPTAPVRRRVTVFPAERPPAAPPPAAKPGAEDVIQIADLPEYLRQHGLRAVRMDWPAGSPRPTLIVENAQGDAK